jgi:hypothetical protein
MAAVLYEMDGRDEEPVGAGTAGATAWQVFRNKDVKPRYYLVGVLTQGDALWVVEVFYPTEDAYKRHHGAVTRALEGLSTR